MPLPDVAGRRQMLDYYLGDKPVAPDVDASVLARNTAGFSGADISNLVRGVNVCMCVCVGCVLGRRAGADMGFG